jgi:hypothetical protein
VGEYLTFHPPLRVRPELWAAYGARIAAAVSGDYGRLPVYRQALVGEGYGVDNGDLRRLAARAMPLGFQDKWPDHDLEELRGT